MKLPSFRITGLVVSALLGGGSIAVAQSSQSGDGAGGSGIPPVSLVSRFALEGPPAPIAPEVIVRDEQGRATIRAVRVDRPPRIDGQLDEAIYQEVPAISGFIQMEPQAGAPATDKTEAWISFDDDNVYVSFRAWDSQMDLLIATEMRRDSSNTWQGNDIVSFIFDTFYDKRNSLTFTINPLGGRSDGQVTNERQYSSDWNPVWDMKTGRFDGGWTVETRIPFKSIRYSAGTTQVWGFNAMRIKRAKNEISTVTLVPPARGQSAFQQPSYAATLFGIEAPSAGRTLDLKPFVTSNVTTDRNAGTANDPGADFGLDAKYSLTQNLTADFTYRTDFAQVEADEQQVNLTRFSLFFPEKREFFLENQGTFSFGGVNVGGGNNNGGGGGGNNNGGGGDAPILFYSRRIGLSGDLQIPLQAGGRLTGRAGRYTVGVLNIQAGDEPRNFTRPTNFTVMRLKRDVLRRSSIGALFANRSVAASGIGTNQAYGVDGTFGFFENLYINTYWARTQSDDRRGKDTSYRGQLDYTGDRYALQFERLAIGDNFNPEVGFLRRDDVVRDSAQFKFSPRPKSSRVIRKYSYEGSIDYIENGAGRLESRERQGEFALDFQNADKITVRYTNAFEFLPDPFEIADGIILPVGGYAFDTLRFQYNMGQQRTVSANLSAEYGTFYSGHKTTLSAGRGRMIITNQLSVEPTYSLNRVDLPQGRFTTHLLGSRIIYTMTPMMFVSALMQYNSGSDSVSTNARLRWEYQPGSELFVVYNDERSTLARSFPSLTNRSFIVKVNKLFRF